MKNAYNETKKDPMEKNVQDWKDTVRFNLLNVFVNTLSNLTNTEAAFIVNSDSMQTAPLMGLIDDLEDKRFTITESMLANGDYYVFPAVENGKIKHTYLEQNQVRILKTDGDNITDAYGVIDWLTDSKNNTYFLLRHHTLDTAGTLAIEYTVVDDKFKKAYVQEWAEIDGSIYRYTNANHIGFGRYKSPVSSRGLDEIYGVPLNFGCRDVEERIFNDLKLFDDEYKNGKSVIFTDPRNLLKDEARNEYRIAENIIPVQSRAGQGNNIDIFNPSLRYSEHYGKLMADFALYEKAVGTSKGILTDNETSYTATATAVKRANADTLALIDKIRNALDKGNKMTLLADCVYLNIASDLWAYSSEWYDPFEDPAEQWLRLREAVEIGAAEVSDLTGWIFPNLTDEQIAEKLARIKEAKKVDTEAALESILKGQ